MNHNECYLRKQGRIGYGTWTPASMHHRRALELYIDIQKNNKLNQADPVSIYTTKYDGSTFMAQFSKKAEGVYFFQEEGSEDGYEIMFCSVSLPSGK